MLLQKKIGTKLYFRKNIFYFMIADDGIGIRNSFLQNGIFAKDDRSAIELAVGGISTKKTNERALGLSSAIRLCEYMSGSMSIESGMIQARFEKNITRFEVLRRKTKGVTITVAFPLKPVNVYNVLY